MNFKKIRPAYVIAIALVAAAFLSTEPVQSNDNIFKRGVTAVKDFFKGDKDKEEADIVEEADTVEETGTVEEADTTEQSQTKGNIFKRGVAAVKGFFKGGNDEAAGEESAALAAAATLSPEEELAQLYENTIDDNLSGPSLGAQKEKIKAYQLVQAKRLIAAGERVETMRNGEVIIATVACGDLFYPNDTVLRPTAGKQLRRYVEFLQTPDRYRMLLAMHSDDTGSEAYTDALTSSRVIAVLNWFNDNAAQADYVIPYAMGASEPLRQNNSVENRECNRRLEIYLVPGREMIKAAEKGALE